MQMTEEDWISKFYPEKFNSKAQKMRLNIDIQKDDLKKFDATILNDMSIKRLDDYKKLKNEEFSQWTCNLDTKISNI